MQGELVVYGVDDHNGRAYLAISALHHCGKWLLDTGVSVRFVAVNSEAIKAALELLRFHTGLQVTVDTSDPVLAPEAAFGNAGVYVAVVTSDPGVLGLPEAVRRGVSVMAAIQFPEGDNLTPVYIERMACAFDPIELAAAIRSALHDLERDD